MDFNEPGICYGEFADYMGKPYGKRMKEMFDNRTHGDIDTSYKLSIIKSDDGDENSVLRYFYEYAQPKAGEGHFIHTYQCDGNPIPSFAGEPEKVALHGDIEQLALDTWMNLNEDNKVSLYVSYISLADGSSDTIIINKHDQEEEA